MYLRWRTVGWEPARGQRSRKGPCTSLPTRRLSGPHFSQRRNVSLRQACMNLFSGNEFVTDTLELTLAASGCDQAPVRHKPRLLSDNGPSYIAGELAEWIGAQGMSHARGAPFHPQTQGKIERWHQTLKNRVLLENYFLPGDLERQIEAFIEHYNHRRTLHSPGHG
jgi:transposase InsO family protein